MNVVVIGSGLSGLTAAAYLAQAGHQVAVFEQDHRPGGVTAPFEADGYRWDLGQLLIEGRGPDKPLGLILAELGIADQVRVRVEDRGCVFPDFALLKPDTYQGPTWRMEQLKELFPAERAGLDRYWADYVRLTRAMTLARRMERAGGWQARALRLRLLWTLLPLLSRACGSSAPSRRAAAVSTALSRPRSRRPGRSFTTPLHRAMTGLARCW